jgi:predicted Zn-dependent protease with MMP-like domain
MPTSRANLPDAADLERLARRAIQRLPPTFRGYLTDIVVRVEEFADDEALRAVGLQDRWELVGLYQGRPLSEQSIWSSGDMPNTISLFRRPLLAEWVQVGGSLQDMVTHVIVHEVGHHFGLSDAQMEAIEGDET